MSDEDNNRVEDESDDTKMDTVPQSHSTSTYKVLGELSDTAATGVIGRATATSSVTYGVLGTGDSPGTQGVVGAAAAGLLPDISSVFPAGIWGYTDRSSTDSDVTEAYGVYGQAAATGGQAHGVYGTTDSSEGYGVYSNDDSYTDGTHEVAGHVSVSNTGLSAYPTADVPVDPNTTTTVTFDGVDIDDFGGHDTSTGVYTIQAPGDYHVDFLIDWNDGYSEGERIDYELRINGSVDGGLDADTAVGSSSLQPCRGFSKALFGLSQGDTIEVAVYQTSGNTKNIYGGSDGQTYLTIHKFG